MIDNSWILFIFIFIILFHTIDAIYFIKFLNTLKWFLNSIYPLYWYSTFKIIPSSFPTKTFYLKCREITAIYAISDNISTQALLYHGTLNVMCFAWIALSPGIILRHCPTSSSFQLTSTCNLMDSCSGGWCLLLGLYCPGQGQSLQIINHYVIDFALSSDLSVVWSRKASIICSRRSYKWDCWKELLKSLLAICILLPSLLYLSVSWISSTLPVPSCCQFHSLLK